MLVSQLSLASTIPESFHLGVRAEVQTYNRMSSPGNGETAMEEILFRNAKKIHLGLNISATELSVPLHPYYFQLMSGDNYKLYVSISNAGVESPFGGF